MIEMAQKNPFFFSMSGGNRVGEARTVEELRERVKKVPIESLQFHLDRGDFVKWLMYMKELGIAARVRAMKDVVDIRGELLYALSPPRPEKKSKKKPRKMVKKKK